MDPTRSAHETWLLAQFNFAYVVSAGSLGAVLGRNGRRGGKRCHERRIGRPHDLEGAEQRHAEKDAE